jgi:CheY-like chemotaxis protein
VSRILVVENDPTYRATLDQFLSQEGYSVISTGGITEARRALESGHVDLAVIDIRLTSEHDDKDLSGLELAGTGSDKIPKIILTAYPSVELVRASLGRNAEGISAAFGFVSKEEGLEAILRYIRFALCAVPSSIRDRINNAFGVVSAAAIPGQLSRISAGDAAERVLAVLNSARVELSDQRKHETIRATQYHYLGLIVVCIGIATIICAAVLMMLDHLSGSIASLVSSLVTSGCSVLLFAREDRAHSRARDHYEEIESLYRTGFLLEICATIESSSERDKYRVRVIEHAIASPPQKKPVVGQTTNARQAKRDEKSKAVAR